jgi:hypothetical protein
MVAPSAARAGPSIVAAEAWSMHKLLTAATLGLADMGRQNI